MASAAGYSEEDLEVLEAEFAQLIQSSIERVCAATAAQLHGAVTAAHVFHLPGKHDQMTHGRGVSTAAFDDIQAHAVDEPFDAISSGHGGYTTASGDFREFETTDADAALAQYFMGAGVNEALRKGKGTPKGDTILARIEQVPAGTPGSEPLPGTKIAYIYHRRSAQGDVDAIDAVMSHSHTSEDMVVYRGAPAGKKGFGAAWRGKESMAGATFHDHAYTSTSGSWEISLDYAEHSGSSGVLMRIALPKGSHALAISVDEGGGEGEVLLPRGKTFKIVRDNGVMDEYGGVRVLDVMIDE